MEVMGVPGAASIGGSPLAASGWRGLPRHMQLIWPQAGAVSPVTCSLSGLGLGRSPPSHAAYLASGWRGLTRHMQLVWTARSQ